MEWQKLLSEKRIRELVEGKAATSAGPDERTQHGRDYDRAIFSTPVRRMQDKTQVFPLEPHDAVRTRLTHSLEVSNIARNMARTIGNWLLKEEKIDDSKRNSIEMIAATCGLIHDLGNPPFGHAGEDAIRDWFVEQEKNAKKFLSFKDYKGEAEQLRLDFLNFEGNAQTIRLVSKLQVLADLYGLNFTCATMSALCKYIVPSHAADKNAKYKERKKPGFFASEQELVEKIQKETGTEDKRNPITYIVEAADDIAYSVADIEDGIKKGIMTWDILKGKLEEEFQDSSKQYLHSDKDLLKTCIDGAKHIIEKDERVESVREHGKAHDDAMAQAFGIHVIIQSAKAIQQAFEDKYDDIMNGDYPGELFEDSGAAALIAACKNVGHKYIYCAKENLKLELMGRRVIHDLMDIFWEGASKGSATEKGFARKVFDLTSENYCVVYKEEVKKAEFPDRYHQMQLMTDYICGMTDTFACTLHKRLTNG
ncbi:MAG: dNTP triphosphohydrolase [Phycisphaerae bacterium]|nr:dNTP triphosphohydrolase [Phycisphaerae bacterium]